MLLFQGMLEGSVVFLVEDQTSKGQTAQPYLVICIPEGFVHKICPGHVWNSGNMKWVRVLSLLGCLRPSLEILGWLYRELTRERERLPVAPHKIKNLLGCSM